MLNKYIMNRSCSTTFQSQLNSTNHSNQQKNTLYQQQIHVNSIKCNTKLHYTRITLIQRIPIWLPKHMKWLFARSSVCCQCIRARNPQRTRLITRYIWLPQKRPNAHHQTKQQYSSNWISAALMCQNFSLSNVQKHYYKQKHYSQLSNVYQQLQQLKVFQSNQTMLSRPRQENQVMVVYRVNRVLRMHQVDCGGPSAALKQNKQQIHMFLCFAGLALLLRLLGRTNFFYYNKKNWEKSCL